MNYRAVLCEVFVKHGAQETTHGFHILLRNFQALLWCNLSAPYIVFYARVSYWKYTNKTASGVPYVYQVFMRGSCAPVISNSV